MRRNKKYFQKHIRFKHTFQKHLKLALGGLGPGFENGVYELLRMDIKIWCDSQINFTNAGKYRKLSSTRRSRTTAFGTLGLFILWDVAEDRQAETLTNYNLNSQKSNYFTLLELIFEN